MASRDMNLLAGIVLVIVGVLLVVNKLSLSWLVPVIGIALIVLGVLILLEKLSGGPVVGVVAVVLGIVIQLPSLGIANEVGRWINLVVGVLLIVLGGLKAMGR